MLQKIVADLRQIPPLLRSGIEMARLLDAAVGSPIPALPHRPGGYTRTRAYGDDRFEVLLLEWSAGAVSAIHDHGGQHCWFVVLEGQLRVDDYLRLDRCDVPGRAVVRAGESRTLGAADVDVRAGRFDIHRVAAGEARAVSLHVYAAPLRQFLVYDETAQRCLPAWASYDRTLGLLEPCEAAQ